MRGAFDGNTLSLGSAGGVGRARRGVASAVTHDGGGPLVFSDTRARIGESPYTA